MATTVSVESVDPVYQQKMISEMLPKVGYKSEVVVGWYHSHPGFGCWLSFVDVKTQRSFEQLNSRAIALVIDPVQSISGHTVVLEAFRTIDPMIMAMNAEPRITTSNLAQVHIPKASIEARMRGLNKLFYPMLVNTRDFHMKEEGGVNEIDMLRGSMRKKVWRNSLLGNKSQGFTPEQDSI